MRRCVKRLLAMLLIFWLAAEPVCVNPFVSYADEVTVDDKTAVKEVIASDSNAEKEITNESGSEDTDAEEDEAETATDSDAQELENDLVMEDEAETATDSDAQELEQDLKENNILAEDGTIVLSEIVDDVEVVVTADAGVIPEDAILKAVKIDNEQKLDELQESIAQELAQDRPEAEIAELVVFDVSLYDSEGNEIQPDTEKGEITVAFHNINFAETSDEADVELYHFADENATPVKENVEVEGSTLSCEVEHFSLFGAVAVRAVSKYEAMIGTKGYSSFNMAFSGAKSGDTIMLMKDIPQVKGSSSFFNIKKGRCLTLDLNGHNIGWGSSRISIYEGELHLTGKGRMYERSAKQSPVVMYVNETGAKKNFCRLIIDEDVTLEGWAPVFINPGNTYGVDSGDVSVIVKGTLNSVRDTKGNAGAGIYVNGQIENPDPIPKITVEDSATITSEGQGIYAAGRADITVAGDAQITGNTSGIEMRAGKLTVMDNAQITGLAQPSDSEGNGSGSTTSGAGIAIAQHSTKLPVEVTISGGTISGYTPVYESNPQNNDEEAIKRVSLTIEDGTFSVINGGTQSVYSEDCKGFITGGSYSLKPDTAYIADGYMRVPPADGKDCYTVEQYRFAFADGTKTAVTLDTADESKKTYSFHMLTDYEGCQVVSSQPEIAKVVASADDNNAYVIEAVAAGTAQIIVEKTEADGSVSRLTIDVVVQEGGADLSVTNGAVELDTADVRKPEAPAKPEGMTDEQYASLVAANTGTGDAAAASIAGNAAVTEAETSGFDHIQNLTEVKPDIPTGVEIEIYPKQKLEELQTDLESITSVDADGNEVTSYTPVISKVVYDISAYMKVKGSQTETKLDGVTGSFRFRIPVPTGISASAKYAIVDHEGDARKSYLIQGTDPSRYITVTTEHFSPFILTFSKTSLYEGSGSSNDSDSSSYSSYTWHQDENGWWITKADGSYPVNCWYQAFWNDRQDWYHFDMSGYMQTGWFTDTDGRRYYLHPVSDGTQGHMYVGWKLIDGVWYYFQPVVGGPLGSLLTNGRTPDGYMVNENGARIE